MTTKSNYPMEAFALAAVLFSSGMKEAMLVGIGLIFGDVLQGVIGEWSGRIYRQTLSALGAALTCGAVYTMFVLTGVTPGVKQVIGFALLGLLVMKQHDVIDEKGNVSGVAESGNLDFSGMLTADSFAYGMLVLLAALREYVAGASVFGYELTELGVMSSSFGKTMFALIGAAILIAVVNRVLKTQCEPQAALWVCIPVLLLEAPFVWNHVPELVGTAVGIAAGAVVYLTLRGKLAFSDTETCITGIPAELAMLGIVYMIFSLL